VGDGCEELAAWEAGLADLEMLVGGVGEVLYVVAVMLRDSSG
jgi:hypothetical protein